MLRGFSRRNGGASSFRNTTANSRAKTKSTFSLFFLSCYRDEKQPKLRPKHAGELWTIKTAISYSVPLFRAPRGTRETLFSPRSVLVNAALAFPSRNDGRIRRPVQFRLPTLAAGCGLCGRIRHLHEDQSLERKTVSGAYVCRANGPRRRVSSYRKTGGT